MSKSRVAAAAAAAARALPYKPPRPPKLPAPPPPPLRRRALPYILGASAIYIVSAYTFYLYRTLSAPPSPLPQDADVSSVYDTTAASFDRDVSFVETSTGIVAERKKLTKKARGHVLEVSAGTGRNSEFYDLKRCESVTFVDLSTEMMRRCRWKWERLHPEYAPVSFHTQSALLPLLHPPPPGKGYTTILQTFGLCSTPHPAALLRHLGTLLDRDEGRILLLEHGRGHYGWVNWVLDRTAGRHAERHGCWWNRDLERVVQESGLVVVGRRRRHVGTLWVWELRAPGKEKGAEKEGVT